MNKIYKIVDGQYFEGDLYTITDAAGGKKKIVFSPSQVITQGTLMDSEKFNQFQKNGVFYVNATHSIDGGNSVYTIEDFEDVGGFGLFNGFKLMLDPPESCVAGAVISFLGNRYDVKKISNENLVNLSAGDISKGLPAILVYDNGIFKIENVSYNNLLPKGTGLKATNARQLEEQIENLSGKIIYEGYAQSWDSVCAFSKGLKKNDKVVIQLTTDPVNNNTPYQTELTYNGVATNKVDNFYFSANENQNVIYNFELNSNSVQIVSRSGFKYDGMKIQRVIAYKI